MNKYKNKVIVLICAILLSACSMDTQEVIKAVKECEDAGLIPTQLLNGLTYNTINIRCDIPEKGVEPNN